MFQCDDAIMPIQFANIKCMCVDIVNGKCTDYLYQPIMYRGLKAMSVFPLNQVWIIVDFME